MYCTSNTYFSENAWQQCRGFCSASGKTWAIMTNAWGRSSQQEACRSIPSPTAAHSPHAVIADLGLGNTQISPYELYSLHLTRAYLVLRHHESVLSMISSGRSADLTNKIYIPTRGGLHNRELIRDCQHRAIHAVTSTEETTTQKPVSCLENPYASVDI